MRVKSTEMVLAVLLAAMLAMATLPAAAVAAATDDQEHWAAKRQWFSFRAGYAKSATADAANGSVGGGIGYSRMLPKWKRFRNFSLGGYAHMEQLGHFGDAKEFEIPVTLELARHFRWGPKVHPYLGFGSGAFYRKLYRTGDDIGVMRPGRYIVLGMNSPVDGTRVLGVDVRFVKLDATNIRVNPVFGAGDNNATHWSVKLNYTLTY
jgi:opacity protein-like surface antigen